jgi:peptide/nickel transport system substrate-binding protein
VTRPPLTRNGRSSPTTLSAARRVGRLNPIEWLTAIFVVGLVAAAALAFAGRAPGSDRADDLVVSSSDEPKSLDPHVTTSSNDFRILTSVYEGLTRFRRGTLEVEPALATGWTVSKDGKRYRFELRKDVTFHDGSRFDAEAVKFNFDRMLDKEHPFHDTGPFPLAFFFQNVEAVTVVDPFTVELSLSTPFAPLLSNLAYPIGFIVSPASVARFGRDFGRHGGGTGPYRIASWTPNRAVILGRYPGYWGPEAKRSRVVFRPISDRMTRVAELVAGGTDLDPEVGADNVDWFRRSERFEVHQRTGPHLWFLILNARRPPFDDVRVRRAVNLAVDKRRLAEQVLADTASVPSGVIADAFAWARNPNVKPYPHDADEARALVQEAGAEGRELTLLTPKGGSGMLQPELMATAIQADLERIGLTVHIRTYEWNAYLARVNRGLGDDEHMAAMAWMTNDPDTLPFLALRSAARPPDGFNSGWYANAEVDRLVEAGRRETDPKARARVYRQLDAVAHDDAPWLFVASWRQAAVTRADVHGFEVEPSFFLRLDQVEKR